MTELSLTKVSRPDDRTLPVFSELDRLTKDIERRARAFWAERGCAPGRDLDDWLRAEREVCWPAAALSERGRDFLLDIALPGYESSEIELTVTPREVIVHATRHRERAEEGKAREATVRWSEFRGDDVYRRFELPADIDVAHAKATLRHGLLHFTAPKAVSVVTKIPTATAA